MTVLKKVEQREEVMRKDVVFKTQGGVTLAAWHYLPDQSSGKVPTIVMAHGFSAVKEMYGRSNRRSSLCSPEVTSMPTSRISSSLRRLLETGS